MYRISATQQYSAPFQYNDSATAQYKNSVLVSLCVHYGAPPPRVHFKVFVVQLKLLAAAGEGGYKRKSDERFFGVAAGCSPPSATGQVLLPLPRHSSLTRGCSSLAASAAAVALAQGSRSGRQLLAALLFAGWCDRPCHPCVLCNHQPRRRWTIRATEVAHLLSAADAAAEAVALVLQHPEPLHWPLVAALLVSQQLPLVRAAVTTFFLRTTDRRFTESLLPLVSGCLSLSEQIEALTRHVASGWQPAVPPAPPTAVAGQVLVPWDGQNPLEQPFEQPIGVQLPVADAAANDSVLGTVRRVAAYAAVADNQLQLDLLPQLLLLLEQLPAHEKAATHNRLQLLSNAPSGVAAQFAEACGAEVEQRYDGLDGPYTRAQFDEYYGGKLEALVPWEQPQPTATGRWRAAALRQQISAPKLSRSVEQVANSEQLPQLLCELWKGSVPSSVNSVALRAVDNRADGLAVAGAAVCWRAAAGAAVEPDCLAAATLRKVCAQLVEGELEPYVLARAAMRDPTAAVARLVGDAMRVPKLVPVLIRHCEAWPPLVRASNPNGVPLVVSAIGRELRELDHGWTRGALAGLVKQLIELEPLLVPSLIFVTVLPYLSADGSVPSTQAAVELLQVCAVRDSGHYTCILSSALNSCVELLDRSRGRLGEQTTQQLLSCVDVMCARLQSAPEQQQRALIDTTRCSALVSASAQMAVSECSCRWPLGC